MKVLLTGATGLLGGHLLQALQARGEHIRALVLPIENAQKLIAQDHGSIVAEQARAHHPYQTSCNASWRHDVWQR